MSRASEGERVGELTTLFNWADSHRQQYIVQAEEWYKLYIGYRPDLPKDKQGRANLHIPRTYEIIDTIRSRHIKAMFGSRPYIDLIPRLPVNVELDDAFINVMEGKARVAGAIIDEQLTHAMPEFYKFITDMLIKPMAIASVGWKHKTRKVKVPRFRGVPAIEQTLAGNMLGAKIEQFEEEIEVVDCDDNEFRCVAFEDFWWDPRGTDIDNCRFVFHRRFMTKKELTDLLTVLHKAGLGRVSEPNWDSLAAAASVTAAQDRVNRQAKVGLTAESQQGVWQNMKEQVLHEVLFYWEDAKLGLFVNRMSVLYDGKSPYTRHGKKPFLTTCFEPLTGEMVGLSAVQVIEDLQHEINTMRNQRIDNVSLVLNRMWKARRGAGIEEDDLVSRPNGIVWYDTQESAIQQIDTPDVTSSSFQEERISKEDMENALGTPAAIRGVQATRQETAYEVATKSSSAGYRFDSKILVYETLCLKRLAYLMDMNNQQFIDQARVLRVYGPYGAEWKKVQPWELAGEYDYYPAGSSVDPLANKDLRRAQLTELMPLALQNPWIKQREFTKLLLETYDIRAVDTMLKTEQEMAAEQQAAQIAALQAQVTQQATSPQPPTEKQVAAGGGARG